jgi:hypothetical protein
VDRAVQTAAPGRPGASRRGLHYAVCVFLIVFGITKIAELIDWSRLHGDAVTMLGLGGGSVTALLVAGKGAELLLTAAAALALARRNDVWLLAALAGWTADLALLAVVAGICGDMGRLVQHGLFFAAFAGLLVVICVLGRGVRAPHPAGTARGPLSQTQEIALATLARLRRAGSRAGSGSLPLPGRDPLSGPDSGPGPHAPSEPTRQDLPVRRSDTTRQELPVRRTDVTRQDLPVRGGYATPSEPPSGPPPDDVTLPEQGP